MKTLLTFVVFALCATSTFAQQALANKPPKVFGPVKTIRYEYGGYNFNRDKTRIEELVSNGRTVIWSLTAQGRLLTSEVFEHDGSPSGTKSLYNYDSAGRLASIVNYLLGSLKITETFAYPEPRRVKITRVFESRKDSEIETDEYDANGNITKATFQNADGVTTEFYKYDERGNPTEFVSTHGASNVWIREIYQYEFDSYGNWTTETDLTSVAPRAGIEPKTTIKRKIVYYYQRLPSKSLNASPDASGCFTT
jgi:YD repeat-containing protein